MSDGTTVSSGDVNVSANTDVYAKYTASYGYTINYFVGGTQDATLTVHGTSLYNSNITAYPDKCPTGYRLEKATLLDGSSFNGTTNPLVITDTAANNVLNVYYVPNEFKISYAYTGTVPDGALPLLPGDVLDVPAGTAKTVANAPALIGYTFSGWTTADAVVATDGSFTMPQKNVTFTGSWTAQQFDVTYALSSDSATPAGVTLPTGGAKTFGETVTVEGALHVPGYTFTGWTTSDATVSGGSFAMPANNVAFVGKLTANTDTAYKIEYYLETVTGGGYQKADADLVKTGTTDATVTASGADVKTFPGFAYNASNTQNVLTGIVKADGSLVLKLYYDRDEYTVTYRIDGTLPLGFTDNSATLGGAYAYDKQDIAVAAAPQVDGYTFNGWNSTDVSVTGGKFDMPAKNVTFTGSFTAAASNYTIEYYLQDLAGNGYVHETASDETRSANTDTTVTVLASDVKSFPGFTHNGTFDTGVVKADGSLVLEVYYTRRSHAVTYALSNDSATPAGVALPDGSTEKFGDDVTVAAALSIPGYTFSGWTTQDATVSGGSFTMPDQSVAFVGKLTANADTAYKIEYYLETVAGGYEKANADLAKTGTTDATVTASGTDFKTFAGFTYNAGNANNVLQGVVKADGSLVLKLYYERNDYAVTYRLTDDSLIPVGYNAANLPTGGSYAFETANIPVAGVASMQIAGYTFHGWDSNNATVANGSFTMPSNDVVFTGYYTANDNTAYKIEYYLETLTDGSYAKDSAVTKYATTNTAKAAKATAKTAQKSAESAAKAVKATAQAAARAAKIATKSMAAAFRAIVAGIKSLVIKNRKREWNMKRFSKLQIAAFAGLTLIVIVLATIAFKTAANLNREPEIVYIELADPTPSPVPIPMPEELKAQLATLVPSPSTTPTSGSVSVTSDSGQVTDAPAGQTAAPVSVGSGDAFTLTIRGTNIKVASNVEEDTLENGPGWLNTSAAPGQDGVCVVYGHRNRNHLKVLEKADYGDVITVTMPNGTKYDYAIESIEVMKSDDALRIPTLDGKHLMLVTCYPFYYTGHAPEKYVVLSRLNSYPESCMTIR